MDQSNMAKIIYRIHREGNDPVGRMPMHHMEEEEILEFLKTEGYTSRTGGIHLVPEEDDSFTVWAGDLALYYVKFEPDYPISRAETFMDDGCST
jgi:hypothetical protein